MVERELRRLQQGERVWIKNVGPAVFLAFVENLKTTNPVICIKYFEHGSFASVLAVKPDLVSISRTSQEETLTPHERKIAERIQETSGSVVTVETIKFR